ncbi:TonB family protein [Adhaeribacter sp. BT258]|uniref:TonB family protein n=1 Tax=Adhaeribacter terrigena TaxID=2793070 RepID=A0ABS1BZH5_9BACT|nr:energy transducer TonB [Adhaeribacter terrigena]MBK0402458.1 TonB family protein [Adhaeribacter terrigena]
MKFFLLFILSFFLFTAHAQKRTYFDKKLNPTADSVSARYYLVTKPINQNQVLKQIFLQNGRLVSEESVTPENHTRNGPWKEWYEATGKRRLEANYKAGKLNGAFRTYFSNGRLRREELYKKGKLVDGKCYTRTGKDTAFYAFETPPVFPGGNREFYSYLKTNLKKLAKKDALLMKRTYGRTIITFAVEKDGTVTNAKIAKSVNKKLEKEMLKMIYKMPRWQPGKQEGIPVKVLFTLPIRFN